jgi:hypothetical protein
MPVPLLAVLTSNATISFVMNGQAAIRDQVQIIRIFLISSSI